MKVIIVDENDNPIGLAERDQWEKDTIHRVSALWLTNSRGEVLLARRSFNKLHNPGIWGPAAAGTVEEGETYESNIIKEVAEEIGVVIAADQLTQGPKHLAGTPGNYRFVQWYLATLDVPYGALRLQEEEVAEARWVPLNEFKEWVAKKPDEFVTALSSQMPKGLLPEG
jgi:isopentenyl-diphosphate delta-isomerase